MSHSVLIIDDEDDIREVAQLSLELVRQWTVTAATSGHAGIELAAATRPEAILLDVMMPGLDGPATLERLRGDPRTHDIPVIFLTAKNRQGERERLLGLGVAGVLTKPFDPMELADQIAACLGW